MCIPSDRPPDFLDLPYGVWICSDGSAYLFNRRYQPIMFKPPNGPSAAVEGDDRKARPEFVTQFFLWSDTTPKPFAFYTNLRHIRHSFANAKGRVSVEEVE